MLCDVMSIFAPKGSINKIEIKIKWGSSSK